MGHNCNNPASELVADRDFSVYNRAKMFRIIRSNNQTFEELEKTKQYGIKDSSVYTKYKNLKTTTRQYQRCHA